MADKLDDSDGSLNFHQGYQDYRSQHNVHGLRWSRMSFGFPESCATGTLKDLEERL